MKKLLPELKELLLILLLFFVAGCPICSYAQDTKDARVRHPDRSHSRPERPERPERPGRPDGPSQNKPRPQSLSFARVARVINGDTILVTFNNGGEPERVSMIGVEAPEPGYPSERGYRGGRAQNYGQEASDFTATMLSNRDVWLQFDAQTHDRRGRLMAYVWTEKPQDFDEEEIRWQMFNARLLLDGCARAVVSRPNSRYARLFAKFQKEAREESRGLWWQGR